MIKHLFLFHFRTGHKYEGVKFEKGNCGVSIMRSGRFACVWFCFFACMETVAVFQERGGLTCHNCILPLLKSHHLCCLSSRCLGGMAYALLSLANCNCIFPSGLLPRASQLLKHLKGGWEDSRMGGQDDPVLGRIVCRLKECGIHSFWKRTFEYLAEKDASSDFICAAGNPAKSWTYLLDHIIYSVNRWLHRQKCLALISSRYFHLLILYILYWCFESNWSS